MKKIKTYILFGLFILIGIVGYFRPLTLDLSAQNTNTLSATNKTIAAKIHHDLVVEIITPDRQIRDRIHTTLSLFQRENTSISSISQRDILEMQAKQDLGLKSIHNLIMTYKGHTRAFDIDCTQWGEDALGGFLQKTLQQHEQWAVFLSGHDEPLPMDKGNRHFSRLTTELKRQGLQIASINLTETHLIPDNTKILIIADNQTPMLPLETDRILHYLQQGGNLLWLTNPTTKHHPKILENFLGIEWSGGTILDPKGTQMGTPHPAISIISQYTKHPLMQSTSLSVFPWATPITLHSSEWNSTPLLVTNESTYLDKGAQGPFIIGAALTRNDQKVVVIGNTHFLSNSSVHNYGNLNLATNIFTWLSTSDEPLKSSQTNDAIETPFVLNSWQSTIVQYIFPYVLAAVYLCLGWYYTQRRKQKRYLT